MENKKSVSTRDVEERMVVLRNQAVIADADVALLYGVQTKEINQAVRNNRDKFPNDYVFELNDNELRSLRSKVLTTNISPKSRSATRAFTEKGLYMLATILKSDRAKAVTFAIIETFVKVRGRKRELVDLHKETDKEKQTSKMKHFGEVLTDIVMPDLETQETESSLVRSSILSKECGKKNNRYYEESNAGVRD